MSELLSWHRVGQKVASLSGTWVGTDACDGGGPALGEICTIAGVHATRILKSGLFFELAEYPGVQGFDSKWFRPVYPEIIDQLRKLDAPAPELEDAHA